MYAPKPMFTIILSSIPSFFISFFMGSDYEEGTIRNKIIIGKKRRDIYLSNLLISFLALMVY